MRSSLLQHRSAYVSSFDSQRSALRLGMKQYSPPRLTTKAGVYVTAGRCNPGHASRPYSLMTAWVRRVSTMKRLCLLVATLSFLVTVFATTTASAHVHGITPLLTLANACGVTSVSNTGANRAQGDPIVDLIPRDVGSAPLDVGDGGFSAPVGCATHGP
jgi:hypothetical protein